VILQTENANFLVSKIVSRSNSQLPTFLSQLRIPVKQTQYPFLSLISNKKTMKLYYIETNPESNGKHLVHQSECIKIPNFLSRRFIGYFNSCNEALKETKKTYQKVNGCPLCLSSCHETKD